MHRDLNVTNNGLVTDTSDTDTSVIEMATNGGLTMEFNQKPLPDVWIALCTEYPALANCAIKTLMPFATTYICESGFSALASLKTKYRHRLCGK